MARRPLGGRRDSEDEQPRSSGRSSSRSSGRKFYTSGDEGMRRTEEELQKQKERRESAKNGVFQPFRFFLKAGETKEAIIVDDKPNFFMWEHSARNPRTGKFDIRTGCIKEYETCPACEKWGESAWVMYLTIIDLTEYKDRKGVTHEFSRKLLVVKTSQQKKFIRRYEKDGTLRGALFSFTRDSENSAAIGNDIEFIEFVDEEELEGYVTVRKGDDGKRIEEKCYESYDYTAIVEEPTAESLLKLTGGEPTPGSRAQRRRDLGDDDNDGWDNSNSDDGSWDDEDKPPTSRRQSRAAAPDDDDDGDQPPRRNARRRPVQEEEEPTPPPRRGASRVTRNERRGR